MAFNNGNKEVTFQPKLTRWHFNQARKHYDSHGHAFAKVIPKKTGRWKWSKEMIRSVIMFVLNDLTNKTAYGTVEMVDPDDPSGAKITVAKGIRYHKVWCWSSTRMNF